MHRSRPRLTRRNRAKERLHRSSGKGLIGFEGAQCDVTYRSPSRSDDLAHKREWFLLRDGTRSAQEVDEQVQPGHEHEMRQHVKLGQILVQQEHPIIGKGVVLGQMDIGQVTDAASGFALGLALENPYHSVRGVA